VFAIQVWRKQHGEFPSDVQQLAGGILAEVPLQPGIGSTFHYVQGGPPELSAAPGLLVNNGSFKAVRQGQPYIACFGSLIGWPPNTRQIKLDGKLIEVPVLRAAAFPIPLEWSGEVEQPSGDSTD
jgi:hypothetical protein